jgi:K+-sensing histidine kinase KdpD
MSISARISYVQHSDLLEDPGAAPRPAPRVLPRRRLLAGLALAVIGLALLTLALTAADDALSVEGAVLLYLLAVVAVALVGGLLVALPAAVAAALLINFYFVAPLHTLDVRDGEQALALGVFVAVAVAVSGVVELAARRARAAEHAKAEAETLAALAGAELDEGSVAERAGWGPPEHEAPLRFDVPIGRTLRLVGRGPALFAEDQRALQAFAAAAGTAVEGRRLTAQAREARALAVVDRQRMALLAAVGHDLRTPLAGIKAAVSSLRQTDVEWDEEQRDALLATIEDSADRLDAVVANLLDASRLQAGALSVKAAPVALDEVVGAAVLAVPGAARRVEVEVPDDLPLVLADAGLLERVLANLLDNALRHGGGDGAVQITASAGAESAKLAVIDHGPGVPPEQREQLFTPFRGADDRDPRSGLGLGLSVARGFAEAMGGGLAADHSAGGGLTMRLRLPLAR